MSTIASEPQLLADRYEVRSLIGKGGMGEVLLAYDIQLAREVAIKRITRMGNDRAIARFVREARVQARLDHPAIAPVYELAIEPDGKPFIVMKRLAGQTIGVVATQGGVAVRSRVLRAFAEVCRAVEFAHRRGVIHRDLKPENILLGDLGEVYVLDWGVAKVGTDPTSPGGAISDDDIEAPASARMTKVGFTVGTPGYMSPEQMQGRDDLDARADVYGLGCCLFELLSGMPLARKQGDPPLPVGQTYGSPAERAPLRDIPPELDDACIRACALERAERMTSAGELADIVQRFLDGDRDLAARGKLAAQHLAVAQRAFAMIDPDEASDRARLTALREASTALALDPTLRAAAELVGRLMLEPPAETPPEVLQAIRDDQIGTLAHNARTGMLGYLGYVAVIPTLIWTGSFADAGVLFLAICAAVIVTLIQGYISTKPRPIRTTVVNAILIGVVAHIFSPFLLAPGAAAVTAMMMTFAPSYEKVRNTVLLAGAMFLAIVVPWFLEVVGVLSATTHVTRGGIQIDAPGLVLPPAATVVVLVLFAAGLLGAATGMSTGMRSRERKVRAKLHLQAWQLRQLAPPLRPIGETPASGFRLPAFGSSRPER